MFQRSFTLQNQLFLTKISYDELLCQDTVLFARKLELWIQLGEQINKGPLLLIADMRQVENGRTLARQTLSSVAMELYTRLAHLGSLLPEQELLIPPTKSRKCCHKTLRFHLLTHFLLFVFPYSVFNHVSDHLHTPKAIISNWHNCQITNLR